MKRFVLLLPALAFLGGVFFAGTYAASADDPQGAPPVIASASAPPPVVSGQSAVDKINCSDGSLASWHQSVVTYTIVSDSSTDWVDEEMARAGAAAWNNKGGPYVVVESSNAQDADFAIGLTGSDRPIGLLGVTAEICPSASLGITEAAELIFTDRTGYYGVESTVAHETGHVLGLGHSNDPRDLMATAALAAPSSSACPSNLDIAGLNGRTDPVSIPTATLAAQPC